MQGESWDKTNLHVFYYTNTTSEFLKIPISRLEIEDNTIWDVVAQVS